MMITVSENDPTRPVVSSVNVVRDEPRLKIVRVVCHVKWPGHLSSVDDVTIYDDDDETMDRRAVVAVNLPALPPNPPPGACSLPPDHPVNTDPEWWTMWAYGSDKYDVLIVAMPVTDYCGGDEVYPKQR